MAHAAKISVLTDDLITSVTNWTSHQDGRQFRQAKDAALKTFKSQQHVRVNQFDIQARLEGLVEKFFVLNNEPLADALKVRLDELATTSSKWKPEVLALLLSLSDRPVEKTNIERALKVNVPEPEPQLTWADILAEDPLTEEGVWDDIEIESDYSDRHAPSLSDESVDEQTTSTNASSVGEDDIAAFARTFLVSRDSKALDDVRAVRSKLDLLRRKPSRTDSSKPEAAILTELQAAREIIAMLHGLPSGIFESINGDQIRLRPLCRVSSSAPSTSDQVMRQFAAIGSQMNSIRRFAASSQHGVVIQRLQAATQQYLRTFGKGLSDLEQKFVSSDSSVVVSLISVHAEVEHIARPLILIARSLPQQDSPASISAIELLNNLFEEACTLQLVGEEDGFASIARLFIECLEVYLRPVKLWMVEGKLQDSDNLFFVKSSGEHRDRGSIWHSRFHVDKSPDGSIAAPVFMQQMADRIFKAGKSVMFLETLGRGPKNSENSLTLIGLNADEIIDSMLDTLLPFSGVFGVALNQWIDALDGSGARSLRQILMSECGLQTTIKAMEHLFLGRNGAQFQLFAHSVFVRIDSGGTWDDRFLLTELAYDAFGSIDAVDLDHLSIRIRSQNNDESKSASHTSEALDSVILDYSITWSLQNVLTRDTLATCQQTFSTVLRTYRAQYNLNQYAWTLSILANHTKVQRVKQLLALRQRLSWFVGIFRGYTSEMISLATKQLYKNLDDAADVDGMTAAFTRFRNDLAGKLLLTKNLGPIQQALLALLELCEDFGLAWKDAVAKISQSADKPTSRQLAVNSSRVSETAEDVAADETADLSDDEDGFGYERHARGADVDVSRLLKEFERQLSFALAGLRGVSRVEAEPAWITLSEKLQWGAGGFG